MVDFSRLSQRLESLGMEQHASEVHGLVSGYLCGGGEDSGAGLMEWLGQGENEEVEVFFGELISETRRLLADPEFVFQPLLPDDERTLTERGRAVSRWAAGFISGFGAAGGFGEDDLEEEVKEVLSDLHKISTMADEVPESEENEADLTEIVEYVRVSALLVFASCALTGGQGEG